MFIKFLLPLFIVFLTACQSTTPPTKPTPNEPVSPIQDMLDKHLTQWKQAKVHDYTYEFQRSCFCMRDFTKPVLIRVDNDVAVEAKFKDTNEPLSEQFKNNRQTIDYFFERVQNAIDRKAHSINVKYNEQYGFPTSISIDYDERMADEELYLKASSFVPKQ